MMSIFLILMGVFVNAPLEELANGNVTPAVAKAPWYFVGLQEMLAYFHPVGGRRAGAHAHPRRLGAHPLHRSWPARATAAPTRPSERKVGVMLFTIFWGAGLTITFLGAFFRGPGLRLDDAVGRLLLRTVGSSMGNWKLTRAQEPQALTEPVLREMRHGQVGGLTRRQLIRRSIGAAMALWLLEVTAGTLGLPVAQPGAWLRWPDQPRGHRRPSTRARRSRA